MVATITKDNSQDPKNARRRSMLPQLAQKKSTTRIPSPTKQTSPADGQISASDESRRQFPSNARIPGNTSDERSKMPPPSTIRRQMKASADATIVTKSTFSSALRRSSAARSTPIESVPSIRPRSTSSTRPPPSTRNRSYHTRSASHQVTPGFPSANPAPAMTPFNQCRASSRLQKPSFSAHQQHYSPSKPSAQPKPPLPSPRSTSSSPATTDADPAHTPISSTLSIELLQLHFLHSLATPTLTAWTKSAESHFRTRFSELGMRSAELHAISSEQQGLLNALALTEWGAGIPSAAIGEKVEVLSRDLGELDEMVREEGKFERIRALWEVWFREGEKVRQMREGNEPSTGQGAFVEGIGDGWKAEAMVLERELGYVKRDFEAFGEVREGSGLGRMVGLGKQLCWGLLEELDVMQWIEDEVMKEESIWVDEMVGNLGKGVSDGMSF